MGFKTFAQRQYHPHHRFLRQELQTYIAVMLCLLISLSENWPQRPPGALTQAIWKYGDKPKKKKLPPF
jgi:hypothetical protein